MDEHPLQSVNPPVGFFPRQEARERQIEDEFIAVSELIPQWKT